MSRTIEPLLAFTGTALASVLVIAAMIALGELAIVDPPALFGYVRAFALLAPAAVTGAIAGPIAWRAFRAGRPGIAYGAAAAFGLAIVGNALWLHVLPC